MIVAALSKYLAAQDQFDAGKIMLLSESRAKSLFFQYIVSLFYSA
jgi:hypothetical protein